MRPAFLRPAFLAPAAVATAIVAWRIPIDFGPVGKVAILVFIWLFLALGLSELWNLVALGRDLKQETVQRSPDIREQLATARAAVAQSAPAPESRTTPSLDDAGKAAVRAIVALFAETAVFAPQAPTPAHLFEAAADQDTPITQGVVLTALHEAGYYHDDFVEERCMANLAFHASHTEQFEETLRSQIVDIVRLSRGALDVRDVAIDLTLKDGSGPQPDCTIRMVVNGAPVSETYAPAAKYLSTHLHVALAIALRRANSGERLAWRWDDQGVWLCALKESAFERLNAGPGTEDGAWEWVDDAEPISAGDMYTR